MRSGVLAGGNWIIDQVKIIDAFPEEEKLATIISECASNGGSAYNVLKGLVKLKTGFPLGAVGLVGDDDRGHLIINECRQLQIDVSQLQQVQSAYTSYTDVMSVKGTGRRTFFHQRGANALLDIGHFDLKASNAKIFHLGYLLLLDNLDILEADGLTRAAKLLRQAKQLHFITSIDIVSEESDRFRTLIPPALPFTDILFVNEFEASKITGLKTTLSDGTISLAGCKKAASKMITMGVKKWVIVHFPDGVLAMNANNVSVYQPGLNVPAHLIVGSAGAGDAFAAGVLAGIHNGQEIEACLRLGVCAAASSLFTSTSSDGILNETECLCLAFRFGYKKSINL